MRTEQQVCNLHQAKRLQELGVLQDSIWYFVYYTNSESFHLFIKKTANNFYNFSLRKHGDQSVMELGSAFTISELAVMLQLKEGIFDPLSLADQLISEIESGVQKVADVNYRLSPELTDSEHDQNSCAISA